MDLKEEKVNIRGFDINYLQTGNGEHSILWFPGTLGTIWNNFDRQLEKLDRNKFTIVAWDPPGYGKSRPPDRTFSEDFLEQDAAIAYDLMQVLGHKTFSAVGLCNGGRTCCALAAMYPDSIRKIVLISTNSYMSPEEMERYESYRDVTTWPEGVYKIMSDNYGHDAFQRVWSSWTDTLLNRCKKQDGHICTSFLEGIHCPTLIVQGAEDRFIDPRHASFLNTRIRNSRVHIFPEGHHLPHKQFPDEFNELATNFLSSSD